jgi:NitT/TauT family transport system substrate-binding protein
LQQISNWTKDEQEIMKKVSPTVLNKIVSFAVLTAALTMAGCSAAQPTFAPTAAPTQAAAQAAPARTARLVIAGPATPSSIPLLIAASKINGAEVQVIENNAQANTAFLRGDIDILVNGLSVGVDLYRNEAPVQIVNTYVTGMSFLVTNGEKVENLAALKGQDIYIPFQGSPIEEATSFLARKEGLKWGVDLKPIYSPFDASIALLKQGKAKAVVLPEPFVSMVEGQPGLNVSLDLYKSWNAATGQSNGYPQVAAFVKRDWAETHAEDLTAFNTALTEAVKLTEESPEEAVSLAKGKFKQPEKILLKAVSRMHYAVLTGEEMKKSVSGYYELIGKPLDDKYKDFYYIPAK